MLEPDPDANGTTTDTVEPPPTPDGYPSPANPKTTHEHCAFKDVFGLTWHFAMLPMHPTVNDLRDELYDMLNNKGSVTRHEATIFGSTALRANYPDMSQIQAIQVLLHAPFPDFLQAVGQAYLDVDHNHRTWSQWAHASIALAGIDPETLTGRELHDCLAILVMTGRTPPQAEFISSAEAKASFDSLKALVNT